MLLVALLAITSLVATEATARTIQPVVVYDFSEGSGSTVGDSGVGPPLDLAIADPGAVTWVPGGGLRIDASTTISSGTAAQKVNDAVVASGELTVEAWIHPSSADQDGPARIVSISADSKNRNLTLGQGRWGKQPTTVYDLRLRSSATNANGQPATTTPSGAVSTALQHVVSTRDPDGTTRIYVDGVLVRTGSAGGDLDWVGSHPLLLGNEVEGNRPWLGTYCHVSLHDVALTQEEVGQRHADGCQPADNTPPTVEGLDDQASDEGEVVSLPVEASDDDGDPLAVTATNLPGGLSVAPDGMTILGTVDQTAAVDSPYDVDLDVDDGRGGTATTSFTWVVSPVNVAPVLDPIGDLVTGRGTPVAADVTASDIDGDGLTFGATGLPDGLSLSEAGDVTGTPTTTGAFDVVVTVSDGTDTDQEALTWTIVDNTPPVLDDPGPQSSVEGASVSLSMTAQDDEDDPLVFDAAGLPAGLTIDPVTGDVTGTIDLAAAAGSPYDTTVSVSDGVNEPVVAAFTWTVTAAIVPLPIASYDFSEGAGAIVGDGGTGPALDLVIADPARVTWIAGGGLAIDSPTALSSTGSADKVTDAVVASGEVTVEAWITPANDTQDGPARIVSISGDARNRNVTIGQGQWGSRPSTVFDVRLRSTATSSNGQPSTTTPTGVVRPDLTHVAFTRDVDGSTTIYVDGVAVTSGSAAGDLDWSASYPLRLGNEAEGNRPWLGTYCDVAIYDVALGEEDVAARAAAGCPVGGNQDPTLVSPGDQNGVVGDVVELDVEASDPDADDLSFTATDLPDGLVIDPQTGRISGTIAASAASSSPHAVTIAVDDGRGGTDSADLTWTVQGDGTPPIATPDAYEATEDEVLVVPAGQGVLANDEDPDGGTLVAVPGDPPTRGDVVLDADGAFTYTPGPNVAGVDQFTYLARGDGGDSDEVVVTISIDAVPDAPTALGEEYVTGADTPLDVAAPGVLANDVDVDDDPLSAVLVRDAQHGTLTLTPDGGFRYQPDVGFTGVDDFGYHVTDGGLASADVVATIDVQVDGGTPPRFVTGAPGFRREIIDTTVDEAHMAVGADFDGDGDTDVVGTDYVDDEVLWYDNTGGGEFVRQVLDDDLDGAYPANVTDLDGDGDVDVLAAGYDADTVVWYDNDGGASFQRKVIDSAADGAHSLVPADLDADGDLDLVTTNQDADTVTWYDNDGSEGFTRATVDATADGAKRADVADMDGDGDLDIVAASYFSDEVAWYDNDGDQGFTKRGIDDDANGAYYVHPADLDGDGDVDVLAASRLDDTVAWHDNDGSGGFTKRPIDTNADGVRSVISADVDGDGVPDAIAASVDDDTISWYRNDGTGGFSARPVDTTTDGAYGISTVDFDGDGDVDVLSSGRDDNSVSLQRQQRDHSAQVDLGGVLVLDADQLLVVDDGPAAQVTYTLRDAPVDGLVEVDGVALDVSDTFTQAEVDDGSVTYAHDGGSTDPDAFAFTVTDGSGTAAVGGAMAIGIIDPADVLVHLPLDEGSGTTAADVGGRGNDASLVGGAAFGPESPDGSPSSVVLDGSDDAIVLPPLAAAGSGLTLATWFRADGFATSDARLISQATGLAADDHAFMLSTIRSGSDNRLRARVRVGGRTTTLVAPTGALATGTWYHAAVTYDGSLLRIHLDGIEVASTVLSGPVDVASNLDVAVGSQPPGAGGRHFDGRVDDVRILQRALSGAELADIVASRVP